MRDLIVAFNLILFFVNLFVLAWGWKFVMEFIYLNWGLESLVDISFLYVIGFFMTFYNLYFVVMISSRDSERR